MQRSICNNYQLNPRRFEEMAPTVIQSQKNVVSGGTLSQQLHWKRKMLNKQGLNKCRQNPTRQAAVRSFKKYHFTNQDFLLRKYLRSVKKDMKPKQCEIESASNLANTSKGSCNSISRPSANNSCMRQRSEIKSKNCLAPNSGSVGILNKSTVISIAPPQIMPVTNTSHKTGHNKSNQNQETSDASSKYQPMCIDDELKLCKRKNWPTYGIERPTYESVLQESPLIASCEDSLRDILNESIMYSKIYCESLKKLEEIRASCETDENFSNNSSGNCIKRDSYRNSFFNSNRINKPSHQEIYTKGSCSNNNSKYESQLKKNFNVPIKTKLNRFGYYDEDLEDEEEDDFDDDDDDEDDEYDDNNIVGNNDGSAFDYEDNEEKVDDDDSSSGNDLEGKHCLQNRQRRRIATSRNINMSVSKPIGEVRKIDRDRNNVDRRKTLVSVDTSDSSDSSSQDNSSASTETCSDTQAPTLQENEETSLINDAMGACAVKSDDEADEKSEKIVKIRNRRYPISILDNNPTLVEYVRKFYSEPNKMEPIHGVKTPGTHSSRYNYSENKSNSSSGKRNNSSRCKKYGNSKCNNTPVTTRFKSECTGRSNNTTTGKYNKKDSKTSKDKPIERVERSSNLIESNNAHTNKKNSEQIKDLHKSNIGKSKIPNYEPLLSTVCSVEDGLDFLENQQLAFNTPDKGVNEDNETITLYNNSTSYTFPVLGGGSPSEAPINKSGSSDLSKEQLLIKSVGTQTLTSPASNRHFLLSKDKSCCSTCKTVDDNFKESLRNTHENLGDLVKGTLLLNSFVTGQSHSSLVNSFLSVESHES